MLVKRKKPTEMAFYIWIRGFPESFHPCDMKNLYQFVKTACRYNNRKWLEYKQLKIRILKELPSFESENLEYFLELIEHLRKFYETGPLLTRLDMDNREEKKAHPNSFRSDSIKSGIFFSEYRPIKEW